MAFTRLLRDAGPGRGLRPADRADHPRRGPHLRHGLAVQGVRDLRRAGPEVRAGRPLAAAVLQGVDQRPAARGGHHRGRLDWRRGSPPAPRTPPAACRWCRSSSSTRCSASSGSATSSGRPPTPGPAASSWAPPPGAPRCSARACSTRTATASCSPRRCRSARPTTRRSPTRWRRSSRHGIERMYGPEPEDVFYYLTLYNENYVMPPTAEVRRGRHHRGPLPLGAGPRGLGPVGHDPVLRHRPGRGPLRPGRAGRALRRRRRAVERHLLQAAARGGAGGRALEPPAPGRAGPHAAGHRAARRRPRARSSPSPTS